MPVVVVIPGINEIFAYSYFIRVISKYSSNPSFHFTLLTIDEVLKSELYILPYRSDFKFNVKLLPYKEDPYVPVPYTPILLSDYNVNEAGLIASPILIVGITKIEAV